MENRESNVITEEQKRNWDSYSEKERDDIQRSVGIGPDLSE